MHDSNFDKRDKLSLKLFPFLFDHLWANKFYYLGGSIALFILHCAQVQIPLLAKELANGVEVFTKDQSNLYKLIGFVPLIIIFRSLSRLLFFYPARIQQKFLRLELLQKIEKAYPGRYKDYDQGQLFEVCFNDINRIRGSVGFGMLQVANVIIALSVYMPKILTLNDSLIFSIMPLLFSMVLFSFIIAKFQKYVKENIVLAGEFQNKLIEVYNAKDTIQNFHVEDSLLNKLDTANVNELNMFFKANLGRIFAYPLIKFGLGVSLILGFYTISKDNLSVSELIYYSGILYLILEPLVFISWIGVVFSQALAGFSRLQKINSALKNKVEVEDQIIKDNENLESEIYKLKLWKDEIDLNIKDFNENKISTFAGETGVGKTTILQNLVYVMKNIKKLSISFVPQEVILYNDNIENNIFLLKEPSIEEYELSKELYSLFSLEDIAPNFEEFLKVEVGENGKKVSGGQAKRIYLIRSLVSGAKYQIWDDPFNSIDLHNETKIMNHLKTMKEFSHMQFIFSSHRFNTFKYSDFYYLIDKKGIVEAGTQISKQMKNKTKIYEYFKSQLVESSL